MSSKVIKWFIRQASIRRPEKDDNPSSSKPAADDKKKFFFPRVSLRKHKRKTSKIMPENDQDVAKTSGTSPPDDPASDTSSPNSPSKDSNTSSPSKSFSDFSTTSEDSNEVTVIKISPEEPVKTDEITGTIPVNGSTPEDSNRGTDSLDTTSDSDTCKSSVFGEYDLKDAEDIADKNETQNSPKNENIAVFDEDGDITATTVRLEDTEPRHPPPSRDTTEPKPLMGILKKDERPKTLEKSKVKIVITQPSPTKTRHVTPPPDPCIAPPTAPPIAPKPVLVNGVPEARKAEPEDQYPDDLNPFGEDDEVDEDPESLNPFGTDSEQEDEQKANVSIQSEGSSNNATEPKNPFGEDDLDGRLSPTNPFAGYEDVPSPCVGAQADKAPTLPPKSEARLRRGSVSSGPTPHPRKTKQTHHGSSTSLHSMPSFPVPYPRSLVPSCSSGQINQPFQRGSEQRNTVHRDSLPDITTGELKRDRARGSLPPMSRLRFPRKKRSAPLPPNLPPSCVSSRIVESEADEPIRSRSVSISPDPRSAHRPPRPPPPKKSLYDSDMIIQEKILQKI